MEKDRLNNSKITSEQPVVIADECGDSLWDEVLRQEVKACAVKDLSTNITSLLLRIDAVQVSDTIKVK